MTCTKDDDTSYDHLSQIYEENPNENYNEEDNLYFPSRFISQVDNVNFNEIIYDLQVLNNEEVFVQGVSNKVTYPLLNNNVEIDDNVLDTTI